MADRFYYPDPMPAEEHVRLTGEEHHHLARVRRVRPGERVELFDGAGTLLLAEVVTLARDHAQLRILSRVMTDRGVLPELVLAVAAPKADRLDWLVEKATELGVSRLVPLRCERSSVDPRSTKLERLRKRVIEASKQCGRTWLMELDEPRDWARFAATTAGTRWLADPSGRPGASLPRPAARGLMLLAVGPEGGFTPDELQMGVAAGWSPIALGPTILRIETAALCLVSQALGSCLIE